MIGAIIGDIVGSRWEFNPTNDYNFELFSDENGFTDDTICTVAVADALLKGRDYGESIHEWCRRYPHPMGGYGGRFAQWVRSDNPQPYGSYGNGAAMRISPVGMWFEDREELLEHAKKTAECSHNHPEGIRGAQTVALAVYYVINLRNKIQHQTSHMTDFETFLTSFSGYNLNIRKENVINRFDETCQGTVPIALWIICQSTSFEDAIRKAVSLGADADTLGAIVGSIAEHIWGIPEGLKRNVMKVLPEEMKQVVNQFYEHLKKRRITNFANKYISFFENEYVRYGESYYHFFDNSMFPNECWGFGFEMDCGRSFTDAYGESAWKTQWLKENIDNINDISIIGSGLFSKWRYFNHWAYEHANEKDIEWFLTLFRRMKELIEKETGTLKKEI